MSAPSIFVLPVAAPTSFGNRAKVPRKRKRHGQISDTGSSEPQEQNQTPNTNAVQSLEYTAVVTPAERSQRRLAGLSLDQEPPLFPFPHAATTPSKTRRADEDKTHEASRAGASKQSLHSQHLAAMTALLHRSMMSLDYTRARRALGLILSNEVAGQAIDIRNGGLWGIGAEILLQQGGETGTNQLAGPSVHSPVSREGFEQAKLYYERLMIQYPMHRTWPDVVNALDFCIAMFGLWIYVTNQESLQLQKQDSGDESFLSDDSDSSAFAAKNWELDQAKSIAEYMDKQMRNVPFNGNTELIRLRAMVALWTADLVDALTELDEQYQARSDVLEGEDEAGLSNQIERMVSNTAHVPQQQQRSADNADDHRKLASKLFSKLRNEIYESNTDDLT